MRNLKAMYRTGNILASTISKALAGVGFGGFYRALP
jgi:hypothetical protein